MSTKKRLASLAATTVLAAVVIVSISHARLAKADDGDQFLAFGVVHITRGQSLSFHALSIGDPRTETVQLAIYDTQGQLLATSHERLLPGQAATLELPFGDQVAPRLDLYAVMRFTSGRAPAGYIIPTLGVIDGLTGKTVFVLGGDSVG